MKILTTRTSQDIFLKKSRYIIITRHQPRRCPRRCPQPHPNVQIKA